MLSLGKFTLETRHPTAFLIFSPLIWKPVLLGAFERNPAHPWKIHFTSLRPFNSHYNWNVSVSFLPLGENGLGNTSIFLYVSDGPKKQSQTLSFSQSRG